ARPEFNASPTTLDRVWNTMIRFDHQINANNTWNVRWLRESSPQLNQIIPVIVGAATLTPTLAASREEHDIDQTVAAAFNSSFGNTRFNTLRFTFTREDVAFANAGFDGNGQRQDLLPPSLNYLTFTDQQSAVAQARVNNAYAADETFAWFIPGKGGDHNLRAGLQYEKVHIFSTAQDNANGVFTIPGNTSFNASDFRTYPERLQIRVPGAGEYTQAEHFFGVFLQDKWRLNSRLTLSLG